MAFVARLEPLYCPHETLVEGIQSRPPLILFWGVTQNDVRNTPPSNSNSNSTTSSSSEIVSQLPHTVLLGRGTVTGIADRSLGRQILSVTVNDTDARQHRRIKVTLLDDSDKAQIYINGHQWRGGVVHESKLLKMEDTISLHKLQYEYKVMISTRSDDVQAAYTTVLQQQQQQQQQQQGQVEQQSQQQQQVQSQEQHSQQVLSSLSQSRALDNEPQQQPPAPAPPPPPPPPHATIDLAESDPDTDDSNSNIFDDDSMESIQMLMDPFDSSPPPSPGPPAAAAAAAAAPQQQGPQPNNVYTLSPSPSFSAPSSPIPPLSPSQSSRRRAQKHLALASSKAKKKKPSNSSTSFSAGVPPSLADAKPPPPSPPTVAAAAVTTTATAASDAVITDKLNQDIQCAICLDIQFHSQTLVPCGHSYCESCLEQSTPSHCPTCRQIIQQKVPAHQLDNLIGTLLNTMSHLFETSDVEHYQERKVEYTKNQERKRKVELEESKRPARRRRHNNNDHHSNNMARGVAAAARQRALGAAAVAAAAGTGPPSPPLPPPGTLFSYEMARAVAAASASSPPNPYAAPVLRSSLRTSGPHVRAARAARLAAAATTATNPGGSARYPSASGRNRGWAQLLSHQLASGGADDSGTTVDMSGGTIAANPTARAVSSSSSSSVGLRLTRQPSPPLPQYNFYSAPRLPPQPAPPSSSSGPLPPPQQQGGSRFSAICIDD